MGKLSEDVVRDIAKNQPAYEDRVKALFLSEEDFIGLANPLYDLSGKKDKFETKIKDAYYLCMDILKSYCDLPEKYYHLISIWIIGTYFHDEFPTYPYLFLNAMKGSGKSRLLRLITYLSKEGCMLNSLTEAVLFRTKGTLGIDEFEGITRKGSEALKELLNSAYKKGISVKRMKKKRTEVGEEMVVEEFDVFRPIALANINGIDDVLGDRCITIILDKSNNPKFTKKVEVFDIDTQIRFFRAFPFEECRRCRLCLSGSMYSEWNNYVSNYNDTNNTNNTNNTNDTNDTNYTLFKRLYSIGINGRDLELSFPLFMVSSWFGNDILDKTIEIFNEIVEEKKKEDVIESVDISLIDFVSQITEENKYHLLKELTRDFREFVQLSDEWINERWIGKALHRLNLIKDKRRRNYGRLILLDVTKAQEKIKMFK
jgi:hypothetical protein